MKKLMFHYNNFFDLGPFLTFHSNVMDQKMAGAKKVVKQKINFFMPVNYEKEFLKSIHTSILILLSFSQRF